MTVCLRCHRPLTRPTESGFGPVCAKAVAPVPTVERDLFGYDIQAAALAAQVRLVEFIDARAAQAWHEVRAGFKTSRAQVWEARP